MLFLQYVISGALLVYSMKFPVLVFLSENVNAWDRKGKALNEKLMNKGKYSNIMQ